MNKKKFTTIYSKIISLFLIFIFCNLANAARIDDLQKGFERPPANARIMMRWWWFGPSVTRTELERELRVMRDGGIGGVEVQPVYPLLPDDDKNDIKNLPYLSDEFLEMLKFTSEKTKELGMRMDLTLGSGWSFGGAKTPITEAAGQLRVERVKIEAETKRIPLPSMIPSEKLLGVFLPLTYPNSTTDIAGKPWEELTNIKEENVLLTADDAKKASEVLFFISGKSGMQVKRPSFGAEGYVLNHLDKPSVDNYLKNTGDRLFSAFDKSNVPFSVFCDSLEVYNQDWTDDFLAEFQRRRGYDLKPLLPHLVMDLGKQTADVRYDWGHTITEIFNERFMIPMQVWSKQNNTRFRIQGYGIPPAAISSNQWADISDGEGAQWKVVRAARWASSANHIYGRNVTSSETWTWLHSPAFRATPLDMKAEADIHFLQGINQLIGHGWGYTPPQVEYPGWRFYAAGAYSEQNPWWIVMPDLSAYLQRMSWLMRQGKTQNDVALYLPNADAYAHFSAAKVHLIDIEREMVGEKLMPALFESGYNLDFFDDGILNTIGKVEKDNLVLGASKHRVVILPGIERIPLESLRKFDEFVKSGGILLATRKIPSIAPGMKATEAEKAEVKSIAARLFDGTNPKVKFVQTDEEAGIVLKTILQPDAAFSPDAKNFGFVHRQTEDADIYFVANTSNVKKNVEISFRNSGNQAEIWNAMNGKSAAANVKSQTKDATNILLNFEPYQSHVVIFSKRKTAPPKIQTAISAASAIDLNSDWNVTIGKNAPVLMNQLRSWSDDEATKYFSGTAVYEKSINIAPNLLQKGNSLKLDFGEPVSLEFQVQRNGMRTYLDAPIKEAAVIYINEQRAGAVWCPPYSLDVSGFLKAGENKIKIVVGNTAMNYMAGRKLPDYKLLNLRYGERFQPQEMEKVQVLPSGLTGNIRLIAIAK
ncbi:MAG: glycoside hydrolase [Acidobacteriota bacterium]|nr:glycoside hydrolase [Acidobacteriota bacterium]